MPFVVDNSVPKDTVWIIDNGPHYGESTAVEMALEQQLNEIISGMGR